ncbi:hypothetical protein, partial [Escherichia coli]|uniref:hypothetical protein n=4 Tax=Escherichia coli TaxID=562 RepID=UPI00200BEF06
MPLHGAGCLPVNSVPAPESAIIPYTYSLIAPPHSCLLYTNPHPGICDVCQSALGGLFPSGSFL